MCFLLLWGESLCKFLIGILIEAWWMKHWMDHMLGVGHNKDRDGLGLLQQQLHHAQMEAWLLEIILNQSKSSRH